VVAAAISAACGTGPLPEPHKPVRFEEPHGFPSKSDDPWQLDMAIRLNRIDDVRTLLKNGANPNERWGRSGDHHPLQEVFDTGRSYNLSNRAELVRLLLAHGADPNARWCPFESRITWDGRQACSSDKGTFALAWAAAEGSVEMVEMLLRAGARPELQDWSEASALDYAADGITFELISRAQFPVLATRDRQALAWLSVERSRPYGASNTPWIATPISRALSQATGIIFPLPPPPTPYDALSRIGHDTYKLALETRTVMRLHTLLHVGAAPNERVTRNGVDWTPLAMALWSQQYRAARVLLQAGADANARWCFEVTDEYFKGTRTKDPRCTADTGMTPLIWSSAAGRLDALELLLEYRADVSLRDWTGRSALDYATTPEIRARLTTEALQQYR
jgi:ankyrin repeat protein